MTPGLRRFAVTGGVLGVVWAVLTGPLILAGEAVDRSAAIERLDRGITAFVVDHRSPGLDRFMTALTWTGSWLAAVALCAVLVVLLRTRRLALYAVLAVVAAWLGEQLAVTLTKTLMQRPRPPEAVRLVVTHGWSFPSGHTANAVVLCTTATALVAYAIHRRGGRILVCLAGACAVALIAFSRVELGAHWTTDVLASVLWTTTWLLLAVRILRRGAGDGSPLLLTRPAGRSRRRAGSPAS